MINISVPFSMIQDLFPDQRIHEVKPFNMYYSGWECDEWGYGVSFYKARNDDGKEYIDLKNYKVVLTSHGQAYVADKEEMQKYKAELEKAVFDVELVMQSAGFMDYEESAADQE